jgi:hypothetical protein
MKIGGRGPLKPNQAAGKQKPGTGPGQTGRGFLRGALIVVIRRECFLAATCPDIMPGFCFRRVTKSSAAGTMPAIQGHQLDDAPQHGTAQGEKGMGERFSDGLVHAVRLAVVG